MALVVFLRGVNVGGHRTFQPSALARELADLDVVNVGAAGTFVVRKPIGQAPLRAEILRRLPFPAEVMICRGREVLDLARAEAFPEDPAHGDARRFVSVLAKRPRTLPPFPLSQPDGNAWQVRVVGVWGKCALSLWRRLGQRLLYPNEVVEKRLGVAATTRNWNTVAALCDLLQ
jgi:uncharacterized protein (DUF1697 family)